MARWSARLVYYNLGTVYHGGRDNAIADALSRLSLMPAAEPELDKEVASVLSKNSFEQIQLKT